MYFMILFILQSSIPCEPSKKIDKTAMLMQELLKKYDRKALPSQHGEPVEVKLEIYINDMVSLQRKKNHYSMDLYLRQEWKDYRLSYEKTLSHLSFNEFLVLGADSTNLIWLPDVSFPQVHKLIKSTLTKPNMLVRIHPNGDILFSSHFLLQAHCPSSLKKYPFNSLECKLEIKSYAFGPEHIRLSWRKKERSVYVPEDELMLDYPLKEYHIGKENSSTQEMLYVYFRFKTTPGFILHTFLLYSLIVMLSWVGFWIHHKAVSARVALVVTSILTIVSLNTENSITDGITSVYLHFLVCIVYLFAAMVEFVVVGMTSLKWTDMFEREKQGVDRKQMAKECNGIFDFPAEKQLQSKMQKQKRVGITSRPSQVIMEDLAEVHQNTRKKTRITKKAEKLSKQMRKHHRDDENIHLIDKLCKYIFSISFLVVNIVFFIYYNVDE